MAQGRRPRVTIDQLHTFMAVSEVENLRRAAEEIHLSQAAVSQQVQLLERSLGVPLFERAGRGLRLTAAGREARVAVSRALEAVRAVEDIAAAHVGLEQGGLVVSASNIMGVHRLPVWMASFVERYPRLDVRLRLDNITNALRALDAGDVDCAIVGGVFPGGADGDTMLMLERDELVIVVGARHPLASSPRAAAELTKHRYLARAPGSGTELLAQRVLGSSYRTGPVQEVAPGAIQAAMLAGLGYTVMPRIVVERHLASGRLKIVKRSKKQVWIDFYAVRRRGPHTPAVEAFWNHLQEVSAGSPR